MPGDIFEYRFEDLKKFITCNEHRVRLDELKNEFPALFMTTSELWDYTLRQVKYYISSSTINTDVILWIEHQKYKYRTGGMDKDVIKKWEKFVYDYAEIIL